MRNAYLRLILAGGGLAAALLLAGCTMGTPVAAAPPPPQAAPAQTAPAVDLASLPATAPCTAKIKRYQSVLSADAKTGNLGPQVYAEIEKELGQAAAACADGLSRQALELIRASEERHGYHV